MHILPDKEYNLTILLLKYYQYTFQQGMDKNLPSRLVNSILQYTRLLQHLGYPR